MADPNGSDNEPIVFMDIAIGGEPLGRIKFRLNTTTTPQTASNFHALCIGSHRSPLPPNAPLGYKNSKFHLIKRGLLIQGGDISSPSHDGTGPPTSIYNLHNQNKQGFPNENFSLRHEGAGMLSMANDGGGNGCQFFITTGEQVRGLDGRFVCFGRVVEGMEVVRAIEQTRLRGGGVGGEGRPMNDVVIVQCGEM